jgi:cytochrome P450
VARGRSIFATELAAVWPRGTEGTQAGRDEITVDALRLLRAPVSRSTTGALVPRADAADRDRIADLTLEWVDALAPVITAARPPRRWTRVRRREQRALAELRAALRDQGEVRDSALATALAAGVQVPIAAGAWVLCQLAARPDVAQAARVDRDHAVAVVWETLRLYPPTWLLPRIAAEDCVIGGLPLPAYTPIVVSPRALGQLSSLVPGSAEGFAPLGEFDPSRWVGGANRPGAWLPFGAGAHACPGRNLALAQLTQLIDQASSASLSLPGPVRIDTSRGLSPSPALVRITSPEHLQPTKRITSEVGGPAGHRDSGHDG